MQWQDWVFFLGGLIVLASLIPTLRGHQKPALATSMISFVLIAIFAFTMATLGLWLSGLVNAAMSLAWGTLALQRYRADQRDKRATPAIQSEPQEEDEPAIGPLITSTIEN